MFNRCLKFSTSSFLQGRLANIRVRAIKQQLGYVNSFNDHKYVPKKFIDKCKIPFSYQPNEGDTYNLHDDIEETKKDPVDGHLEDLYKGIVKKMEVNNFGSISVEHCDIFKESGDCLLVPIPPDLTPHCGFGLKVLEFGGPKLIRALMRRAKSIVSERVKKLELTKDEYEDQNEYKSAMKDIQALRLGDVVITPVFGVSNTTILAFVIMPYYWEGSTREASIKLQHTIKRALTHLNNLKISSVLSPHIDESLYGYQPKDACEIMVEEAYDTILQLDESIPNYSLRHVRFIDTNMNTVNAFSSALSNIMGIKRPECRTIPAPVYYSMNSRRIIEFDESVLKFSSQYRKITYKKHSVIRKSKRLNWLRNIKPSMWRKSILFSPPPFLLYKSTGLPSAYQLPAKPFYKKNITHELF